MAKKLIYPNKISRLKTVSLRFYSLVIFIATAVFLLVWQYLYKDEAEAMKQSLLETATPIVEFLATPIQSIANTITAAKNSVNIYEENQRLRQENAKLHTAQADIIRLSEENETLRKLLNLQENRRHSYVTARIISDNSGQFYRTLLLAAGTEQGVSEDMPVTAQGTLIGRTIASGANYSRVLLLSDWNSRIPVTIEGTHLRATVAGQNSAPAKLIHLSDEIPLTDGMQILTSGRGGIFPPGITLGQLQIKKNNNDTQYILKPYIDPDRLTFLQIYIKPPYQGLQEPLP